VIAVLNLNTIARGTGHTPVPHVYMLWQYGVRGAWGGRVS
jgi:hypothetical protein